jgi:hypothetical protein
MARRQIRGAIFPVPARPSEGQQKKGKERLREIPPETADLTGFFRTPGTID